VPEGRMMANTDLLSRLRDLLRAVDGKPYLEGALHELMEIGTHAIPCRTLALILLDPETERLSVKIARGLSHRFISGFDKPLGSGAISTAFWERRTLVVEGDESETGRELELEHPFTFALAAPVISNGLAVGYLHVGRDERHEPFSADEILYSEATALVVGRLLDHYSMVERLHKLEPHDAVAGVLRYPTFIERLDREFQRSIAYRHPMGVLLLDVEGYSQLLNFSGADAARDVLRRVGQGIQDEIRNVDFVGKYGADEFIVALTDTDEEDVGSVVHRLRAMLAGIRVAPFTDGLHISGGGVSLPQLEETPDLDAILRQLRANLLRARRRGGNRMVITSPGAAEPVEL
jgi:diguanylate cyclase (GGDEF)-like protein